MLKILFFTHLLLFFFVTCGTYVQATMRLLVLDVGEGQAVVLQREEHALLIDTGHFGKSSALLAALRLYGVTDVEKVILTHLDPDHASGIFTLLHHFPRVEIYESGHRVQPHPSLDSIRWVAEQLDSGHWPVHQLLQGSSIVWRGVTIDILWPPEVEGNNLNRMSLVCQIRYGATHILVMGDADIFVEEQLMRTMALPDTIELLVAGHHGAGDTTSESFLQRVAPRAAVISVNSNNIRGYPHQAVVDRIRSRQIPLHTTAAQGDFELMVE